MSAIDIVENPALSGEDDAEGGHGKPSGWNLGEILKGAAGSLGTIAGWGKGLAQYGSDTLHGERNSVPYGVRLAMAGASTPQDKLATLRQFYKDAMPDGQGDFTFFDPQNKKQMTLNDPGLSSGDLVNAIPSLTEGAGMWGGRALGAIYGGGVGAIPAGGLGGVEGKALGQVLAQKGGQFLTGKAPIDTRTSQDMNKEDQNTLLMDGVMTGAAEIAPGIRNYIASKFLTPNSSSAYDLLASKGYDPSLSQVGSPLGKAVEEKFIQKGNTAATQRAAQNEAILNQNTNDFLDQSAGNDKNQLANALRQGEQGKVGGLKESASQRYEQFPFSNTAIPEATQSKGIIENIVDQQRLGNPAYSFDQQINYGMKKVAGGEATEADLDGLQRDIGTYLRNQKSYDTTSQTLKELQGALRGDLVIGAPGTSQEQQSARQGWAAYKDAQDKSQALFGKQSGVSDGIDPTEGLTEGQSLQKAQNIMSNKASGSDQKAAQMGSMLTPDEKQTMLASILQGPSKGFTNRVDLAGQDYNMNRVVQNLTSRPEQAQQLGDLLAQSQGTTTLSNMKPNTDWMIPKIGTALHPQKLAMNSALDSASKGIVPGNLPSYTSPLQMPLRVGLPMAIPAIRDANKAVEAYRIPRNQLEQGTSQQYPGINAPTDLNNILAKKPQYSVNLDDYIGKQPSQTGQPQVTDWQGQTMNKNIYQNPGQIIPSSTHPSSLGYQSLDNFRKPATEEELQNFMNAQNKPKPQVATDEQLQAFMNNQNGQTPNQGKNSNTINSTISQLQNLRQPPNNQNFRSMAADLANPEIPAKTAAFLKAMSGRGLEDADYNTIVGGSKFNDFSDHPNQVGLVTQYGPSTAAGRYQFTHSTWQDQQDKYGYQNFSPKTQDAAAANLANEVLKSKTGKGLEESLDPNDPNSINQVANNLSSTWTSLPGGPQQGSGANNFADDVQANYNAQPATDGDLLKFINNNPAPQLTPNNDIPQSGVNLNDYI